MSKFYFKKTSIILADKYCIYFITIIVSLNHIIHLVSKFLTRPKYLSEAQGVYKNAKKDILQILFGKSKNGQKMSDFFFEFIN